MLNRPVLLSQTFASRSEEETEKLGRALGRCLQPGDVIGLVGELGAGKTAFVRGVAKGARVPAGMPVNSPTFTIMNLYDAPDLGICHLDLYRLPGMEEWEGVGVPELLRSGRALLVEWADRFPEHLPEETVWVTLNLVSENERILEIRGHTEEAVELIGQWRGEIGSEDPPR